MKKFLTFVAGVVALALPMISLAAFADGAVIPSGTTAVVTDAIPTYFFAPILATLFQNQVIQILLAFAAVAICYKGARMLIARSKHPHY